MVIRRILRPYLFFGVALSSLTISAPSVWAASLELQPITLGKNADGDLVPKRVASEKPRARDYVAYRVGRVPFRQKLWVVARVRDDRGVLLRGIPAEKWDLAFDGVSLRSEHGKGRLTVASIHVDGNPASIVFVVNRSPSLESDGLAESVEARLENWIKVFGNELRRQGNDHQFAVVAYGRERVQTLLTLDTDGTAAAKKAARRLDQDRDPASDRVADPIPALEEALKLLRSTATSRRGIVLITDGEEFAGVGSEKWRDFWTRKAVVHPSDHEIVYLVQPMGHTTRGQEMVKRDALHAFVDAAKAAGHPAAFLAAADKPLEGFVIAANSLAADHAIIFETTSKEFPRADAREHRFQLSVSIDGRPTSSRPVSFFTASSGGIPAWQIGLMIGFLAVLLAFAGFGLAVVRLRSKSEEGGTSAATMPPLQ